MTPAPSVIILIVILSNGILRISSLKDRVSKSLVSSFLFSICHPIPFRKSALQIIP